MLTSTIILIILSLCLGLGVWLIFIWAVRKGEFEDLEGPKYRMLDEDDEPVIKTGRQDDENRDDQ